MTRGKRRLCFCKMNKAMNHSLNLKEKYYSFKRKKQNICQNFEDLIDSALKIFYHILSEILRDFNL